MNKILILLSLLIFETTVFSQQVDVLKDSIITYSFSPTASMTYYVAPNGTDSGQGTIESPLSLSKANSTAEPGDTFILSSGTYTVPIRPANSGEEGRSIVFKAGQGEDPVFTLSVAAIQVFDLSYITIEGITVRDGGRFLRAERSSYLTVSGCTFENSSAWESCSLKFMGDFFRFTGNILKNGTDLLSIQGGNYHLIENNSFNTASHTCLVLMGVQRSVVRGNKIVNPDQKLMEVFATRSREYPDPQRISTHNLIEQNLYTSTPGSGIQYAGTKNILRRNIFFKCGTGMDFSSYAGSDAPEAMHNYSNRFYNNVIYACGFGRTGMLFIGRDQGFGWGDQVIVNNIIYKNPCSYKLQDFPGVLKTAQVIYWNYNPEKDRYSFNNILYETPGEKVIGDMYKTEYWTLEEYEESFPDRASQNIEADPQFADPDNGDFHLNNSSPCIDAGGPLTTTRVAGSGTAIEVEDALFFCDGNKVVEPDVIRVGIERVTITAVDYDANIITVEESVSWEAGAPVFLDYTGQAPDIGAFELEE